MAGLRQPGRQRELIVSTSSLTLQPSDAGKTFCNVGAGGAVTFTLPSAANCNVGDDFFFLSCADQNFAVAGTSGQLIALNNTAATSVTLSTSSEKAGGGFRATVVSGTKIHIAYELDETQTVTIA